MHFHGYLLVILLIYVNIRESRSIVEENKDGIEYRLPNNTRPESYEITLVTNVDKNEFSFSGIVVIDIRVLEASSNIILHARQLNIQFVQLTTKNRTLIPLNDFSYDRTTEFLIISTQTELRKDTNFILTIEYIGELRNDQHGFYRTSYLNREGQIKSVLSI